MTPVPLAVGRADAIDRVVLLADERRGATTFVGIDGPGAAGKSSLARDVAAAVPGSVIVAVDDFARPSVPEWDWARFQREVADPLLTGRSARYRAWHWDADSPGELRVVPPARLVIVEGVSATRREVRLPWAMTVWVDAPAEVRLQRARDRDGEAMLSVWLERWIPSEEAYVEREHPQQRVDLVVSGC